MRLVNILGANSVQHPEHGNAEAGADGVFDLDEEFGQALLAHAGQWRTEHEHIAEVSRRALEELAEPKKAAAVLHYVHGRVKSLEAELAALRDEVAALKPAEKPPTAAEKKAAAEAAAAEAAAAEKAAADAAAAAK